MTPPLAAEEAITFTKKHLTREAIIQDARQRGPLVRAVGGNFGRQSLMPSSMPTTPDPGSPIRIAILDDRIEIENPGLLLFGLTIVDILQGVSKLRNRVIGRVFRELHLIEQWGSGI